MNSTALQFPFLAKVTGCWFYWIGKTIETGQKWAKANGNSIYLEKDNILIVLDSRITEDGISYIKAYYKGQFIVIPGVFPVSMIKLNMPVNKLTALFYL